MGSSSQFSAMKPGKKYFAGGWLFVIAVVVFGFVVLQLTQGFAFRDNGSNSSLQPPSAPPVSLHDDANWLVARCGRPSRDVDTGGFEPAPIVPERVLTYGKAHLKIAYVAADPRGQDPPYHYHWTLMGLVDTRTNHAFDVSEIQSTLKARLPCVLSK
ncbi:MAG TPA: hypothetical protein VKT75_15110 [Acidobacteriaceae bacterium]|nr:hypothetical protein [Acidobacteriaceae bacterium]